MATTDLLERLGIRYPILQAPMAGGPSTPELAAAVSAAGGMGSIGAAYLTPAQIAEASAGIRGITTQPFGINLFCGGTGSDTTAPAGILRALSDAHRELGLEPPEMPSLPPDPLAAQIDAVLEARPRLFSFTFGVPEQEAIERLRSAGIVIAGTATTVGEGELLAARGVDAIVAQGEEAGGHRGTFAADFDDALVPTAELVRGIAARVEVPVIASGGIMDATDASAMLELGASAVQLGTAFLACPESGASSAYKAALLEADSDTTVITRAFSGRPARGLTNAFIEQIGATGEAVPSYPFQNLLTRPMRSAAAEQGRAEFLSLWAGRGVQRIRAMAAGDLVREIADGIGSAQPGAGESR